MRRADRALVAGVVGGVLLLTAACSGSTGGSGGGTGGGGGDATGKPSAEAPKTSAAVVSVEPADGTKEVKPSGVLKVAVASGKLTTVKVTGKDGAEVPGAVTPDGLGWAPTGNLAVSTEYQVDAQAVDTAGIATSKKSTFTTLTPKKGAGPKDNVADNATYGVGMIVSLTFTTPVKDKEAVEKAVTFQTEDNRVVKGHWFGNQRVDFRPEHYWKSNSKVTVKYDLKSVETAPGVYGEVNSTQTFNIGRSRISEADASSKRMVVQEEGKAPQTLLISAGASSPASQNTFNGTMVVMGKEGTTVMDSSTVPNHEGAAYKVEMPHALRLTPSGTYVHGKNVAQSVFGNQNTSHGCIGLYDTAGDGSPSTPAGSFYDASIIGDVVTVKGSVGKQVAPDNGMSGWNLNWSQW
ncbi:Ig-like domain-containing protein [Kitasatospora sp. NPDC096147]|uniref:L,D-transpeptidase n=1 Tax=Kitasatospora sp. NPDC096147 TaxID=3364093 RepID=UPI00382D1740